MMVLNILNKQYHVCDISDTNGFDTLEMVYQLIYGVLLGIIRQKIA